jgi:hypothetical protein
VTITKQIANIMGWEYVYYLDPSLGKYWADKNGEYVCNHLDFQYYLPHAKLLQARMVDDGWDVYVGQRSGMIYYPFKSWASKGKEQIEILATDTEPAAIVELFKKVYGIKEGA